MPKRTPNLPDFVMSLVGHRFLLISKLGSGSYGAVYKALDLKSPTKSRGVYAVKCVRKPPFGSSQYRHLSLEINLHMKMSDHPHIVTLHRAFEDDEFVFLVMDFCPGGDMFTAIAEHKVYANNDQLIKSSFLDLIDAVLACHARSVFHRDLKPENILCSEDGSNIRLTDFGLATPEKVTKEHAGSSSYMSPECFDGRTQTHTPQHADIWALGVILITMITARHPWRRASPGDDLFSNYLRQPDKLGPSLNISKAASKILHRIFQLKPPLRISLPELRQEILKVDRFRRSAEDDVRTATPRRFMPRFPGRRPSQDVRTADVASPLPQAQFLSPTLNGQVSVVPFSTRHSSSSVWSPSSSTDSDGPITPETRPVQAEVEIPDSDALNLDGESPMQVIDIQLDIPKSHESVVMACVERVERV